MEIRLVNPHDCQYVQSRVFLDESTVAEYAEMFRNELTFEPCQAVITPGGATIIYDGNHRAEAAKQAGAMLEIELRPGTEQDAEWLATGANTTHGLRRSADDIEKAVTTALRHVNGQGHSDREIARHCGCDHKTVGKYRKVLEASGDVPQMLTRTVQRNGTEYQMSIPMPKPEPEPEPVQQFPKPISVFVPDEQPRPVEQSTPIWKIEAAVKDWITSYNFKSVESAAFYLARIKYRAFAWGNLLLTIKEALAELPSRDGDHHQAINNVLDQLQQRNSFKIGPVKDGWTCSGCTKHLIGGWRVTYDSGKLLCMACLDNINSSGTPEPDAPAHDDDAPADREPELERCQACLGKCYVTDKGITNIYEINEIMCLVRGVTYPWPPDSQKYAAMTANFTLAELRYEVPLSDWEAAQARKVPEPEPEAVIKDTPGPICTACGTEIVPGYEIVDRGNLYHPHCRQGVVIKNEVEVELVEESKCNICGTIQPSNTLYATHYYDTYYRRQHTHLCRSCASKALHELKEWFLDPSDPAVVAEAQQAEAEHLQHGWYSRDMDKMMRAGLRIFRACDRELLLKEYSKVIGGVGSPDYISGSWKHVERFQTKKALKERMDELEQESNVIFENHL